MAAFEALQHELAHRFKWHAYQRPFHVRARTMSELAEYPLPTPRIPSAPERMLMPWLYPKAFRLMNEQMDRVLALRMGEIDVSFSKLSEYVALAELTPLTAEPRNVSWQDLQWTDLEQKLIYSVFDTIIPAYFHPLPFRKNWLLQFGLDRQGSVRDLAVHQFSV